MKLVKNERPRLKMPGEQAREGFQTWLWICAVTIALVTVLAAAFARAQSNDDRPHDACPPGRHVCDFKITAPPSPQVDRACLRRLGSTAIEDALCVPVEPGGVGIISLPNPTPGSGHVRYEAVVCDDDLGLCSQPIEAIGISVDLDAPSFFEVLRKALGL